jgi:non-ribosomal peptide synthetase component E (peptide arylation enzyme)
VKLKDGSDGVSEDNLKQYIAERVVYYKQLMGGIEFVNQFPRLLIGKVDRKAFKKS